MKAVPPQARTASAHRLDELPGYFFAAEFGASAASGREA
jgi:hypothetical protein